MHWNDYPRLKLKGYHKQRECHYAKLSDKAAEEESLQRVTTPRSGKTKGTSKGVLAKLGRPRSLIADYR